VSLGIIPPPKKVPGINTVTSNKCIADRKVATPQRELLTHCMLGVHVGVWSNRRRAWSQLPAGCSCYTNDLP